MASGIPLGVATFAPAALRASNVGTWERELVSGHILCDATMADIYGFPTEGGEQRLALADIVRRIHPSDRGVFDQKLAHVAEHGGLTVVEYRILPAPGIVRWVLVRGRYARDATGKVTLGRGIVIDITESKLHEPTEEKAFFLSGHEASTGALDKAADHAIAARRAIDEHDPCGASALRKRVDALLWDLGRSLASSRAEGSQDKDQSGAQLETNARHRH